MMTWWLPVAFMPVCGGFKLASEQKYNGVIASECSERGNLLKVSLVRLTGDCHGAVAPSNDMLQKIVLESPLCKSTSS